MFITGVRVNGPKDKFRVDMWKGADRTVNCRYNPEVVGKYTVNIKWEDEHIKVGFTSCPSLLLFSVLEILCMRWAFQWDFSFSADGIPGWNRYFVVVSL